MKKILSIVLIASLSLYSNGCTSIKQISSIVDVTLDEKIAELRLIDEAKIVFNQKGGSFDYSSVYIFGVRDKDSLKISLNDISGFKLENGTVYQVPQLSINTLLNIKEKIRCVYLEKKFIWFDKNGGQIINASLNNITIIGNDEKGRKINVGFNNVLYIGCHRTNVVATVAVTIGIIYGVELVSVFLYGLTKGFK
ncbi:MAG: hypothetical protein WCT77_12630 [Bacteroidota bacterium]